MCGYTGLYRNLKFKFVALHSPCPTSPHATLPEGTDLNLGGTAAQRGLETGTLETKDVKRGGAAERELDGLSDSEAAEWREKIRARMRRFAGGGSSNKESAPESGSGGARETSASIDAPPTSKSSGGGVEVPVDARAAFVASLDRYKAKMHVVQVVFVSM